MTTIRVNPTDVQAYGTQAQTNFDNIFTSLNSLVTDVVGVHYFGGNAFRFKTDAGRMAADFANSFGKDLGAVADAIRQSTSNIAASLGGSPISIQVSSKAITPPAAQPDTGEVDVQTEGLEGLVGTVNGHFEAIRTEMTSHLTRLTGTDWTGLAKDNTVTAVSSFTTSAQAKATAAQDSLTKFINDQITSVVAADK